MIWAAVVAIVAGADPTPLSCPEGTTQAASPRESRCLDDQRRDHGPYVRWYPDGQILERGIYESGRRVGEWETFHANGQLAWKAMYLDDWRHGPFVSFHANGAEAERGTYEHGNRVGQWFRGGDVDAQFEGGVTPARPEGSRRIFPLQAALAGHVGFGSTTLGRGQVSVLGTFGELHFRGTGRGSGRFFAAGLMGLVEQSDLGRCRQTCSRWGVGPVVRYGYAVRTLDAKASELPDLAFPDWYAALELGFSYSRQFTAVPLAGNLDAVAVRVSGSVTGAGWTRRLFSPNSARARMTSLQFPGADAVYALIGIINHGGIFVEASRHYPGAYRVHAGLQFGAGF